MNRTTVAAIFELVLATLLWGFGFPATIWALQDLGPFHLTVVRFVIAGAAALALILKSKRWRPHLNRAQLWLAFWPALFLTLMLILQTWGLKYTTATKAGFITCLYVLMVPALDRWVAKRKLHRLHPVFVVTALAGTALICDFHAGNWNIGDLLTLGCAIAASLQIFWFGPIASRISSAFVFNFWQTAWSALFAFPLLSLEPSRFLPVTTTGWAGLLALSLGSTLIAFGLQIRAQQTLSPSVASLLFLLESPFATLFAITLLGERLSVTQWLGAGLILVSVGAASWFSTQPSGQNVATEDSATQPSTHRRPEKDSPPTSEDSSAV